MCFEHDETSALMSRAYQLQRGSGGNGRRHTSSGGNTSVASEKLPNKKPDEFYRQHYEEHLRYHRSHCSVWSWIKARFLKTDRTVDAMNSHSPHDDRSQRYIIALKSLIILLLLLLLLFKKKSK
jgi:hypothetical protein